MRPRFAYWLALSVLGSCLLLPVTTPAFGSDLAALAANAATTANRPTPRPRASLLTSAKRAFAKHKSKIRRRRYLTIIDYDKSYRVPRLWVIDRTRNDRVVMHLVVSHAGKSGGLYAVKFSNRRGSKLSSVGSYVTAWTYTGRFGYSLKLRGLDKRVNDNAFRRLIVIHPDQGMTHSWGCFMIPTTSARKFVDLIKHGSFLYVHRSTAAIRRKGVPSATTSNSGR